MNLYAMNAFGRLRFNHQGTDEGKGKKGDEGDDEAKTAVPYAEHRKVRQALAKAKGELEAANAKNAELEKKAPDVAKIAAERDAALSRADNADKDLALRDRGVTDADDRAFIRERYNMSTNGVKDAPEFGDWLDTQGEKRWFKAMVPDAEAAPEGEGKGNEQRSEYAANKGKPNADANNANKGTEQRQEGQGKPANGEGKKPAFNPNAGTKGNGNATGRPAFTREEIGSMSSDEYKANRDAIHQARRDGRIE